MMKMLKEKGWKVTESVRENGQPFLRIAMGSAKFVRDLLRIGSCALIMTTRPEELGDFCVYLVTVTSDSSRESTSKKRNDISIHSNFTGLLVLLTWALWTYLMFTTTG